MSDMSTFPHSKYSCLPPSRVSPENAPAVDGTLATRMMEAAAGAFALVAHAAGRPDTAQKNKLFTALQRHRMLARVSRADVLAELARHESNFREDSEVAEEIAFDTLTNGKRNPGQGCDSHAQVVRAAARAALNGSANLPGQMRALASVEIVLRANDGARTAARV